MKNRKRVFIRPGDIKKIAALTSETNVTSYGVMVCAGMISASVLLCYIYRLNLLCSALVFAIGLSVYLRYCFIISTRKGRISGLTRWMYIFIRWLTHL